MPAKTDFPIFERMKNVIGWFVLAVGLLACEDTVDCGLEDTTDEIYVRFHSMQSKNPIEVLFDTIYVDFNQETIGLGPFEEATTLILPLDMSLEETRFHFEKGSFNYHLQISYEKEVYLPSAECGPTFRVYNLGGPSEASEEEQPFDSIAFRVTELTKSITPHVEVYF